MKGKIKTTLLYKLAGIKMMTISNVGKWELQCSVGESLVLPLGRNICQYLSNFKMCIPIAQLVWLSG